MIRMLAIDMDGTCLNEKSKISAQTLQALEQAAKEGICVVPTTGRALSCLPHQLVGKPWVRYVISSNGAMVTDLHTGRSIYRALIPRGQAVEVLRTLSPLRVGLTAHVNHAYLVQGRALWLLGQAVYGRDGRASVQVANLSQALLQQPWNVEELQIFFFSDHTRRQVRTRLKRWDGSLQTAYDRNYVEIFPQRASKGSALQALMKHLELPACQVACIGDGENDLSMFQVAGLRMAMGNGTLALQAQADVILPSNREDGVFHAIHQHLLPQQETIAQ